jgi:type IV secretion system protein VirB4
MMMAQYFGMLPGNFITKRLASQPLSSDNFASFFPLHNNMVGMAKGSQWGMPVAMVETPQGSPYFLNYHNSKREAAEMGLDLGYSEDEEDNLPNGKVQRKENGNARFIGNAGDGKTVTQTLLRSLCRKRTPSTGHIPATPLTMIWAS